MIHYRPQGEGNVFTGVCLPTIGLISNRSLRVLVMTRSVRILLEYFLVFRLITLFILKLFFPDENLKVPPIVHFTWFYKNVKTATPQESKFYQLISLLAAYKK